MIEEKTEYTERVRVKPELRKLIKIEAVKSDIAMGEYIDRLYEFYQKHKTCKK